MAASTRCRTPRGRGKGKALRPDRSDALSFPDYKQAAGTSRTATGRSTSGPAAPLRHSKSSSPTPLAQRRLAADLSRPALRLSANFPPPSAPNRATPARRDVVYSSQSATIPHRRHTSDLSLNCRSSPRGLRPGVEIFLRPGPNVLDEDARISHRRAHPRPTPAAAFGLHPFTTQPSRACTFGRARTSAVDHLARCRCADLSHSVGFRF